MNDCHGGRKAGFLNRLMDYSTHICPAACKWLWAISVPSSVEQEKDTDPVSSCSNPIRREWVIQTRSSDDSLPAWRLPNNRRALLHVYSYLFIYFGAWHEKEMREDWGVLRRKAWGPFKTNSHQTCRVKTSSNSILTSTSIQIRGASESSIVHHVAPVLRFVSIFLKCTLRRILN